MTKRPGPQEEDNDALRREVVALRAQVADLQRAAARHEDTAGVSLAEREELLREAERIAHLGTWTWDILSGRVFWSDEMYRILGIDQGSVTPSVEFFFAAVHPDDRQMVMARAEEAKQDGVLPLVDCRVVRPNGEIRHTTTAGAFLFDAAGHPRRMVGGVLDRTEALHVERQLRSTLALLEEAQRLAQLGSWRFDPETRELEWSDEFRRIADLPGDVTPTVEQFVARFIEEDRERVIVRHMKTLQEPEGGELDGRLQLPNGEIRHVRLKGGRFLGTSGRFELRGTMLDITAQVQMREELAHSQKMEAVGRLAGGIAHDFNNLLTIVTGNLGILADELGSRAELEDCLRAVDSAANLTRRLLAYGRRAQLSLKLLEPNELVVSTLNLLQRLVGDQIRLETRLGAAVPRVKVDPVEIERALVNLVVNAKNVTPRGGLVTITTNVSQDEQGKWVEFAVVDEGPGISETDRPHIFEPFYTTRPGAGGTGLGLATVLGTAEQHGGSVRVDASDQGSTFTILIPAASEAKTESTRPAADHADPAEKPLQLLVVDDDADVAEVTRRILVARGHTVHLAYSPEQAETIWERHGAAIDLVVCDVVMPLLGGPELVVRLAQRGPTPRVLFVSGYNDAATHANLEHPFLPKPFTPAVLLSAINKVLT